MALVYQDFTLEVTPGMLPPVLHVTEYDINMQIDVTFTQRGQPYEIPSGTTAKVEGTLAGHPFRESCTVNGNTVTFILTKNMTAYAGRAWTKIVLTNSTWPVSTCGFWLDCDRAGVEADTVIGAPGFEEQINQGVADYMEHHTVRAEDERLDSVVTFTEEIGRVPLFTNQLPISTDTDGTIYNGTGFKSGYRFNSDGEEVAQADVSVTGFIPCTANDVLRFSDFGLYAVDHPNVTFNYNYIEYYDDSKTRLSGAQIRNVYIAHPDAFVLDNDAVVRFNLANANSGNAAVPSGTAFVRFSSYGVSADSIITVNEEVAYDEHGKIARAALKPDVDIPQLTPLDERITAIENGEGGSGATKDERLDSVVTFTEETGRVPLFTNVIPLSVDTDSTPYQSGNGYLEGYRLNSSGVLTESADAGVTGFIPLPPEKHGAVLRLAGMQMASPGHGNSTNCRIDYYDAQFNHVRGAQTGQGQWVIAETDENGFLTQINLADQTVDNCKPSPGTEHTAQTAYFRLSATGLGANSIITIDEEIAYGHGTVDRVAIKPDVEIPQLSPLDARITALENGEIDTTDPLVKYAEQMDRAMTVGYEPTLTNRPTADLVAKKYLNFLHISDTHGSVNAENAVTILNKLKADGRCSFLIHTGDFHSSTFADVASWNTFAGYIAQATAPVLLVSGNHDVGNNSKSTTNGQTATDAQLYARCFEPYISGWNLTSHPTGKCYWYKDFADEGVRLIGLYDFESDYATDSNGELLKARGYAAYHQAQIDWLVQALLTCPAGYGVMIAKHNPMNKRGTLDNPFNGEFLQGQNTAQTFVSSNMIPEIVQAFMDGATINKTFAQTGNVTDTLTVNQSFASKNSGAHFICYLDGHTHADGVNFLADFPKQLELNIGCDNYHYQHYADTLNQQNTLHQDLLNYVSVDVNRGYVYIQRIGNDYTAQADRRDFTAIDYKNPPTAAEDPSEAIEALDGRIAALEDFPLVKSYTAAEPSTGNFDLAFDRPLKAIRVLIEGVANSDVSAKAYITVQIGVGKTSYAYVKKLMYAQLVSNTAASAIIKVRKDAAMGAWISNGASGAVALTNGWLNVEQTCFAQFGDYGSDELIYRLIVKPDTTNGVSVTTGMKIKVYGLEA